MTILTFNNDSLRRGGITIEEAKEALDDPFVVEAEEGESEQKNPTVMSVGKTHAEQLLEIGVEYKPHETHIYHGRKANAHFRKQYDKR